VAVKTGSLVKIDRNNRNSRASLTLAGTRHMSRNMPRVRCAGFTLVELVIVAAIIGLLAAIAIPNYIQSRSAAQKNACINNLRQIENAIQQWAMETRQPETASVNFTDISPYLKGGVVCPAGGTSFTDSYAISNVATAPTCQLVPLTHVWMGSDVELVSTGSPGQAGRPGTHGHNGGGNGNGNGGGH